MRNTPISLPLKANLGCGFDKREGFLNVDLNGFHEPDLICDVTDLAPLPSSHFEYVLANDVLEHLPRHRTRNTLREWNRILKMGGTLELQVPNVIGLLQLLLKPENQTRERHDELLQCLFGTQSYNGDFHYIGFTEITLVAVLNDCGFTLQKLQPRDEWMYVAIARKSAHSSIDPIYQLSGVEFVDEVYRRLLGRTADATGRAHQLRMLEAGTAKEAVIEVMMASEEYRARHPQPDRSL